jgi:hypothetical protein
MNLCCLGNVYVALFVGALIGALGMALAIMAKGN